VSHLKFKAYWTKIFDYYGITNSKEDENLHQAAADAISLYSDGDFLYIDDPVT